MPVVNPGIRRQVAGAITRLFNSAAFALPLTHTAVPTRGSITPTFTRATTKTWQNNDGYLVTGVAGEIGFVGARRVRNRVPNSETLTAAAGWGLSNITTPGSATAVAPDGTTTAWILTASGASGQWYKQITGLASNGSGLSHIWLRRNTGTGTVGMFTAAGAFAGDLAITSTWTQYSLLTTTTAGGTSYFGIQITTSGDKVEVWHPQFEDVTAQTTQIAGEYVSVGVESAPYYHGSMVDGVKCYDTDINGSPIPSSTLLGYQAEGARTNLCLQSNAFTTTWAALGSPSITQDAIGPDGATSAWTLTDNAAGATESIYQGITLTAAAYTGSVFVAKTEGVQSSYPVIFFYPADGTQVQAATVDTTNGVITDWTSADASTMASGRSVRIVSYNDDFWRVELTKTGTAAVHFFQFFPAGATTATYAGPTISTAAQGSAVFYRAQVELGSFASSDIPTTTAAATRNADVLTYSSAGNIDGTKGWCYAEVAANWSASPTDPKAIAAFQSSIDYGLWYLTSANNLTLTDGAAAAGAEKSFTILPTAQKVAATWSSAANSSLGAAQGVAGGADTFGTAFAPDQIGVGIYRNGTVSGEVHWFGTIRNVRIGQRALSSSELQAITA